MVACTENETGGDEPTPQPQKPSITIDSNTLSSFTEDGGKGTISFTASEAWSAEIINTRADSWISIHPTSGGAGEANITVTTEPNDTPEDRSASIVIKAGSASKTITISQKQMDVFTVTTSETEFGAEGGNIEVVVETNVDFDYVIEEEASEWITYEGTRALETNTLVFAVAENNTYEPRSGRVTITSEDGKGRRDIYVTQIAGGVKIYYTSSDGKIVTPYIDGEWIDGAKIYSNTYENGQGVITFDRKLNAIPAYAFAMCSTLTSITLPEDVIIIGEYAFSGCESLTGFNIPDGVTAIDDGTFGMCLALANVTIPEGVTLIGNYAFANCQKLTEITLPESVTSIGSQAFESCGALTNINLPQSVTEIGANAFIQCTSLSHITIPGSVKDLGNGVCSDCTLLTSVTILEGVTEISSNAFYGCTSLTNITLPESVTDIRRYAFQNCSSLASITIPENVDIIDIYAFNNCQKLTTVYCKPITPPVLGAQAFDGNATGRKIYVPNVAINEYYNGYYGWASYIDAIQGYDF